MKTLVVGASGATGQELVGQLLKMGQEVKVIVRPTGAIPDGWINNAKVTIIRADISEISVDEMANYLKDCQSAASCLGHNLTLKGIYGKPRKLVANSLRLICDAIIMNSPKRPVKFVLMNTTAIRDKDINEPVPIGQRIVIGLVRLLLPPQRDNEKAADYLRVDIGKNNNMIEWVVVRPDSLINLQEVSDYDLFPSPVRNPVFNPGKTSRINVGHFMAKLIVENALWQKWKGQMPVIYNRNF
jgi:hypothetical protein